MTNVAQTTAEYTEKLRQALTRDTTLRQVAAQATTRYGGEQARIDRGLILALNGHVTLHADGSASVRSGRDAEVVYTVNGHCDCPDVARAPEGRCKHRWAKCLVKRAMQAAEYSTSTTDSQGLVLGGHRATADTKRAEEEAAGGLAAIVCGYGKPPVATHEVWYTTKTGTCTQAWQGLTYAQAWQKATQLAGLGYDACVLTPAT